MAAIALPLAGVVLALAGFVWARRAGARRASWAYGSAMLVATLLDLGYLLPHALIRPA